MAAPRLKILLVEDEERDAILIQRTLEKGGIDNEIKVLHDGPSALEYLCAPRDQRTESLPGLVLLDINLPLVDGIEVLKRFRLTPDGRSIPVIVLTGSQDIDDARRAYDAGANSYLVKPVAYAAFTEVLNAIRLYWAVYNVSPASADETIT